MTRGIECYNLIFRVPGIYVVYVLVRSEFLLYAREEIICLLADRADLKLLSCKVVVSVCTSRERRGFLLFFISDERKSSGTRESAQRNTLLLCRVGVMYLFALAK